MLRGSVCLLSERDWMIALADHSEWNFRVVGRIVGDDSWDTINTIVALPFTVSVHPDHKTEMRMIAPKPVRLKIK